MSFSAPKRIVLKFGTGILTKVHAPEPDPVQLRKLMEAVALLKADGHSVVVVSSGAVASGLKPIELNERPTDMTTLQALAAVGQPHLMHAYENLLRDHGLHVAQLLVTHEDLENYDRARRVKTTLERLLEFPQIVPVINENDSVAIEELRFGDNDKLSSRVARLWGADLLMLLTSAPGLLKDINRPEDGPISHVDDVDLVIHHAQEEKTKLGTGGMISKLRAVQDAVNGGVDCIIASGRHAEQIPAVVKGGGICTRFAARK
ncbi:glutamate 5-kinase [Prosthecobacter debontii]|uniref:Glutamate 5-kinase n=1 Tax=Prosthecobacter debontii TaxID=48467 RepID=A0A1T4YC18_9BACT|nr:glutamate 5-kinase [Prosthecobacter debontii]SKA99382.1 glutamate 5-kinase [Prosthecobacter debontii]